MNKGSKARLATLFAALGAASMTAGCVVGHDGGEGGGNNTRIIFGNPPVIIDTPGVIIGPGGREGGEGGEGGEGRSGFIVFR